MKKTLPILLTISVIVIIGIYMIIVTFNPLNKPKLDDISGHRSELQGVSMTGYTVQGGAFYNKFLINKDGIKKDGVSYMYSGEKEIFQERYMKDKRFFRSGAQFDSTLFNDYIYINNDNIFSAEILNNRIGKEKLEVRYKNKKSGEFIEFKLDVKPEWTCVKSVYSNGDVQRILFTNDNSDSDIIATVDLKNKSITEEKSIGFKLKPLVNPLELESLDKWYFFKKQENGSNRLTSINPVNYKIQEYDIEIPKDNNFNVFTSSKNIYVLKKVNNTYTLNEFNTKTNKIKIYSDIPLDNELVKKSKDDAINLMDIQVKDNKFYSLYYRYDLSKSHNSYDSQYVCTYINVVDLNSKENLYLGKITDTSNSVNFNYFNDKMQNDEDVKNETIEGFINTMKYVNVSKNELIDIIKERY